MSRLTKPRDPVTLHFDGKAVVAERGEPAAVALIAAGHMALARSPKFHRPRGPWCLRAACDGCLARVDGVPNVMTCRVSAAEGMRIETQNVVGSGETDLLHAADWFFPEGMNHHELLAGVPGLARVFQAIARRVAGLGKLPLEAGAPRPASRRAVDVLVVGAGASGMATSLDLMKSQRRVEVIDDDLSWGGSVRGLSSDGRWARLLAEFGAAAAEERLRIRPGTTAAGIYGNDVIVSSDGGAEVVTARTLLLAPGAYDGVLGFEGNDLPGVMSARAGCWLAVGGATPGRRVLVVVAEGGGPFGEAYARLVPGAHLVHGSPVRAAGIRRVKEVTVASRRGEERFACDALLVDAPRAPAYELCAQAGAELVHAPGGFVVKAPGGRIRSAVFAAGEVVGTPLDPDAVAREASAIAAAVSAESSLSRP